MESDDEHRTGTFLEPETMKEVLGLFSLFHPSYEFYKDDIIQLWMARNTDFRLMETTDRLMMENRLTRLETIGRRLVDTETMYMKLQMKETSNALIRELETIQLRVMISTGKESRGIQLKMKSLKMMQEEFLKVKESLEMETKIKKMESLEVELDRVKTTKFKLKMMLNDINDGTRQSLMESKQLGPSVESEQLLPSQPLVPIMESEQLLPCQPLVTKNRPLRRMESKQLGPSMESEQLLPWQPHFLLHRIPSVPSMESKQLLPWPPLVTKTRPLRKMVNWVYTETKGIDAFKLETEVSSIYFDHLERIQLIVMAADLDSMTSLPRYKLNHDHPLWFQNKHCHEYIRAEDGKSSISENTLHCSIGDVRIDPITLNKLQQAKRLQTLIIHGSLHLHQLPRELFLMLPYLMILDLSRTNIKELPSSIGKSVDLKYLNLSGTLITTLPYSLFKLSGIQTLKLRGCVKLVCLPKDITNLTNLLHLDVDVACLLASFPPGIGNLTRLQTLPSFVVGKEKGYRITELKNMNLYGTLSIFRLEYVSTGKEAAEAGLINKGNLRTLELQWTESHDGSEILKNLQPPTQIKELQIVGYGGAMLSSWIGSPIYFTLSTITIHDCRSCKVLPSLGKLPRLKILCISGMGEVEDIGNQFCGRYMSFKAFPRLESFTLDEMPKLKKWMRINKGDFPRLQKLNISSCPQLTTLPELSILESLEQLEISSCPLLEYFPTKGLPTSLQYLVIIGCPLLKEWFHEEEGQDGAHVPSVWIDYQQMSLVMDNEKRKRQVNAAEDEKKTKLLEEEVLEVELDLFSGPKKDDGDGGSSHEGKPNTVKGGKEEKRL